MGKTSSSLLMKFSKISVKGETIKKKKERKRIKETKYMDCQHICKQNFFWDFLEYSTSFCHHVTISFDPKQIIVVIVYMKWSGSLRVPPT